MELGFHSNYDKYYYQIERNYDNLKWVIEVYYQILMIMIKINSLKMILNIYFN